MSTWLIDDDKFVRIYGGLCVMDSGTGTLAHLWGNPEGWKDTFTTHLRSFVQDLRCANVKAYNDRYEEEEPFRILSFKGVRWYKTIDLIKALQCVSYNIDEKSVNDCSERLERLINHLMSRYIAELPEYKESDAW
jgi:hypothetical protein